MDSLLAMDYNCPQFVDFSADIDSSGKGDVFFDCNDQPTSNVFQNLNLQTPEVAAKTKYPNSYSEKELLNKMTAALKFIENTPTRAIESKNKCVPESTTFKNLPWRFTGASCKPVTIAKMQRSKSVVAIDKAAEKVKCGLRKRSSSLTDLRNIKKYPSKSTVTYPTTPMCLKRTIAKSKNKIVKSSEDMQLEEIARLQKQMIQRLRYNEMSLKKLNLKPRAPVRTKNANTKPENIKGACRKAFNSVSEKPNLVTKDPKQAIKTLNNEAMMNLDSAFNKPIFRAVEKNIKENLCVARNKKTSVVLEAEASAKSDAKPAKKNAVKMGFHSGIVFHDNVKKSTVVKPFNLGIKSKQTTSQSTGEKSATCLKPLHNLKLDDVKENIPIGSAQPVFQVHKGRNRMLDLTPVDIVLKRRKTMRIRGLALSSNAVRN